MPSRDELLEASSSELTVADWWFYLVVLNSRVHGHVGDVHLRLYGIVWPGYKQTVCFRFDHVVIGTVLAHSSILADWFCNRDYTLRHFLLFGTLTCCVQSLWTRRAVNVIGRFIVVGVLVGVDHFTFELQLLARLATSRWQSWKRNVSWHIVLVYLVWSRHLSKQLAPLHLKFGFIGIEKLFGWIVKVFFDRLTPLWRRRRFHW